MRLKDLAASRVRYGYRRLHVLLLRKGYRLNHKRTYRLYREEGLSIRSKTPKRKRAWRYRSGRPEIADTNQCWAMDFMSDALFDGRTFRLLTVVDCHTRESLAIAPRTNFKAFQVVDVLERLAKERGKPKPFGATTVLSLPAGCSINGPISTASRSSSLDQESQRRTHFVRPSTVECAQSAPTHHGSCRWQTLSPGLKNGGVTTTTTDHILAR
jgi:transposase InsO family protein